MSRNGFLSFGFSIANQMAESMNMFCMPYVLPGGDDVENISYMYGRLEAFSGRSN